VENYIYIVCCLIILFILELPLIRKYIKAKNEYDFSRQAAIIILMIILALIIWGLSYIGWNSTQTSSVR